MEGRTQGTTKRLGAFGIAGALAAVAGLFRLSPARGASIPALAPNDPKFWREGRKLKGKTRKRGTDKWMRRVFASPGRIADGPARPTASKDSDDLNKVHFKSGDLLLFSDGSFRNPGRRRLRVMRNGQVSVLSGRQFRILRKKARAFQKHQAQRAAAETSMLTMGMGGAQS